jgi:hypothetical protein
MGFPSNVAETVLLLVMAGRLLSHDLAAFSAHSFAESAATFSSQLALPSHLEKDSFSLPGQATLVVFRTHSPAMAETLRHKNNRQETRDFIVCDLLKQVLNLDFLLDFENEENCTPGLLHAGSATPHNTRFESGQPRCHEAPDLRVFFLFITRKV